MNNKRMIVLSIVGALALVALLLTITSVSARGERQVSAASLAQADAVPSTISYQGRLLDDGGNPVDGVHTMAFRVYEQVSGGVPLWTDSFPVPVEEGLFHVHLGVEPALFDGRALYEDALALVNAQKAEYGDQYEASAAVRAAWDAADAAYSASLKVARVALQDDPKAHAALMLGGTRKQSLSGWIEQATAFYTNLLGDGDLMAAMAGFGFDAAKLEAEQALVQAVVAANLVQEKEKGEAQDATKQRDASLDAMDAWMSDFKAIARVALEENAQWLEKLGFGAVP